MVLTYTCPSLDCIWILVQKVLFEYITNQLGLINLRTHNPHIRVNSEIMRILWMQIRHVNYWHTHTQHSHISIRKNTFPFDVQWYNECMNIEYAMYGKRQYGKAISISMEMETVILEHRAYGMPLAWWC